MTANGVPVRALRDAVEQLARDVPFRELRDAVRLLSDAYRASGRAATRDVPAWGALAYAATRMPASEAAVRAVLRELRSRCPALVVETVLDLGAGPGTTVWAAAGEFPSVRQVTLVESDPAMVEVGRQLLEASDWEPRLDIRWRQESLLGRRTEGADLVVAAYVCGELDTRTREDVVDAAWRDTRGALVLLGPGSPEGTRVMLDLRDRLLSLGARVIAPCPHDRPCPLPPDDWCHFAARLERSSLHRRLKGGRLPYEDEKFSYVVATRGHGAQASARIVRRPRVGGGQVGLAVCGPDGVRETRVPRSRREAYRRARHAAWGDAWGDA